jgi:hypothetical protein
MHMTEELRRQYYIAIPPAMSAASSVRMMRPLAQEFTHAETRQGVIMTKLSILTELLPKRTTERREKDRERLAQKPCAFDVMKDARAARSMYQSILLRQFMKFLVSCRPFARHRGVNYP